MLARTAVARLSSSNESGSRSALAIASACSVVESTNRRRLTTHQIRVGAVRVSGGRSACDASHHTAISRQAVFPRPVGMLISAGHCLSGVATRSARRFCQGKGSRPVTAR